MQLKKKKPARVKRRKRNNNVRSSLPPISNTMQPIIYKKRRIMARFFLLTEMTMYLFCIIGVVLFEIQQRRRLLKCHTPKSFTKEMIQETEMFCLYSGTVYNEHAVNNKCLGPDPLFKEILDQAGSFCISNGTAYNNFGVKLEDFVIENHYSYYSWIPGLSILMAIIFMLPHMIWEYFSDQSEVNIDASIFYGMPPRYEVTPFKLKSTHVPSLARRLLRRLINRQDIDELRSRRYYLCVLLLLCKQLVIHNVVFLCGIMRFYFGTGSFFWGLTSAWAKYNGNPWKTPFHPKINCSIEFPEIKDNTVHQFECDHYFNIATENIFIMAWVWLAFVAVFKQLYYFHALYLFSEFEKPDEMHRHLRKNANYVQEFNNRSDIATDFFEKIMRGDGNFIVHLITGNDDKFAAQLYGELFNRYRDFRTAPDEDFPPPPFIQKILA